MIRPEDLKVRTLPSRLVLCRRQLYSITIFIMKDTDTVGQLIRLSVLALLVCLISSFMLLVAPGFNG